MKNLYTAIITILIVIFNIVIILSPADILIAAREGLTLWGNNVLPSLLPFVFGINVLLGLGVLGFIGAILAPVMKLFNVPGIGGFPLIVGFTSGYPIGAKVVSQLREEQQLTKTQAERLISFCNNSGPLFILGAVGIGMFNSESVGYFILSIHYGAALITGLIFRYYKHKETHLALTPGTTISLKAAYTQMNDNKEKNFGKLLTDSIHASVQTMLVIGGFIIAFNVILEVITTINLIENLGEVLAGLTNMASLSFDLHVFTGVAYGVIEVANGARHLTELGNFTRPVILATACIISFGGLSIHGQAISFLSKTDISIRTYLVSKLIHAGVTLILGLLFFPF